MQTCPECGASREGAVRYCPNCGLDYWRAAAGEPAHPEPAPVQPPPARGAGAHPGAFIWAGVVVLLIVGGALVAASGILSRNGSRGVSTATPRQLTEEEALIYAFFREVRDPRAAYALTFEGTTTFSGIDGAPGPISTTGGAELYGDDWRGHEKAIQDGETVFDDQVAVVDDIGYLSESGGDWVSAEVPERLQPISPFRRISNVTEVEYLEPATGSGAPAHRLVVTKWMGGRDYSDLLHPFARIESQESRMEIVVDARGVPSFAQIELTVVATDGVESLTIEATFTYHISDWDEVDPVEAPNPGDPGNPSAARATRS